MEYEVRTEGLDDFEIRFRAIKELRDDIEQTVTRAAREAGTYMAMHVPYHSGQLYRAINVTDAEFHAGGAGGGGYWEAHAGVDVTQAPHLLGVIEGTGIYNRDTPTNGIFPSTGNVMAFEKQGEMTVFTAWIRGQEPQRAWFEGAQGVANAVIANAVAGI